MGYRLIRSKNSACLLDNTVKLWKNTRKFLIIYLIIIATINLKASNCKHVNLKKKISSYNNYYRNNIKQQRVLLISFGGFRHDYIESYNLANFDEFINDGVKAAYLNPQFTTQSLPNHWSMSTGAYVETHGIVANTFYDPLFKETFFKHKTDLKWWNNTEPIWVSAVRQGIKTGMYFWPGSEAGYNLNSDFFSKVSPYHDNVPFHFKVNQSLKWLLNDDFKFVAIYHNQPDSISHKYGLNSAEFNVTLHQLDQSFGYLVNQLKLNGMYDSDDFNLIIVSDHGMVETKKNIIIDDYFNENDATIWSLSSNLIHLKPLTHLNVILKKLSRIPDVTITLKENMPDRLNYKNNRRIGEIIISALEGIGLIYVGKEPIKINHNGQISNMEISHELKKKIINRISRQSKSWIR